MSDRDGAVDGAVPDAPAPSPSSGRTVTTVVGGVASLVIGVVGAWLALGQGVGRPAEPGPGMWPLVVCLALATAGVVLVIRDRKGSTSGESVNHRTLLHVGTTLVVYVLLLSSVGFLVSTVLFMTYWLRFLARERWLLTGCIAVVGTGLLYVLFVHLLGVPLPVGILRLG